MRQAHLRGRGPHIPPLDHIVQYEHEPGYVVFTVPSPKRLRVAVAGEILADSIAALLLYESDHLPAYYFPLADVRTDLLQPSALTTTCPFKGTASYQHFEAHGRRVEDLVWRYADPLPPCPAIADYVSFIWNKVDHWYEEDEEIFVHARDPFRRVDCLPSSRGVRVEANNTVLAESCRCVFLFETGLPTRYYMPLDDVRREYLEQSRYETLCPYKGRACYFDVRVGAEHFKDKVWYYPHPVHEAARIEGLVSFPAEYFDVFVDGVQQPRPITTFSHGYAQSGPRFFGGLFHWPRRSTTSLNRSMASTTPTPTDIQLHQKSRVMEILFSDGSRFELSYELLRVSSPSAEVRGHGPGQEVLQVGKREVGITALEPVGNYAVQPTFSDGHDTGIYSWDYLFWLGSNRDAVWQDYLDRMKAAAASRESGAEPFEQRPKSK
jgi:uncharacterized protein (DUF427 family)/DUF971 family protein